MKTIYLTIAEPCHENWNTMTPDQKGRFCVACKKTVVDFSGMTDQELAAYFTKGKENLCGRFYPDQLQRVIAVPPKPVPWMRPFLPLAISALAVLFEACTAENKVMGEPRVEEHPVVESFSKTEKMVVSVSPVAGDTTHPKTKKHDVQVITKKNKKLHPSSVPVDTMRLPEINTINKPGQALDSTQKKPLLLPRKESFIMGRIVLTPSTSKAEKDK